MATSKNQTVQASEQSTPEVTKSLFDNIVDVIYLKTNIEGKDVVTAFKELVSEYGVETIEIAARDNYNRINRRYYTDKMNREVKSIQVARLSEQTLLQRIAFNLVDILFKVKNTTEIELGNKYLVASRSGIGFFEYTMDKNFDKRFIFKAKD